MALALALTGGPALALTGGPALAASAALHPKDGPDADVSFVLLDTSLRATLIFNLAFLDQVLDVPRENPDQLHPVEQAGLQDALMEHLTRQHRVILDGVEVTPVPVAFEVLEPDPKLVPLFPTFGARALTQVRLVLDHPVKSPPERMELQWSSFPPEAPWQESGGSEPMQVAARIQVGGQETLVTFSQDEPGYTWHRTLAQQDTVFEAVPEAGLPARPRLHLGSLLALVAGALALLLMGAARRRRAAGGTLAVTALGALVLWPLAVVELPWGGGGLPDETQAVAIFEPLHANIYRAFDYSAEGDIYDALARSVDGQLLGALYDQVYRGLVMAEHGGAVCRVQEVRPVSATVDSIGGLPESGEVGFAITAVWQVDGIVRHWGHSHWRTNEHEARYTVAARDGTWRIVGSTMLDQRRIAGSPIEEGPAPAAAPPFQELVLPPGSDL